MKPPSKSPSKPSSKSKKIPNKPLRPPNKKFHLVLAILVGGFALYIIGNHLIEMEDEPSALSLCVDDFNKATNSLTLLRGVLVDQAILVDSLDSCKENFSDLTDAYETNLKKLANCKHKTKRNVKPKRIK